MERPLYLANNVQELIDEHISNVDFDKSYKFFHYLQTLNNLTRISSTYKSEGDMEKAYVYLLRFCVLTLEKLPQHPEYGDPKFIKSRDALRREAALKIDELEPMKERLTQRYKKLNDERLTIEKMRIQKEREEQEIKAKLQREKEEHEKALQKARQDELNQKRLERERKKLEDDNLEEREFILKKMDIEKKMRQSRFEQQAMLLRQEAKMEEKRLKELELHQQNTSATLVNENNNSFVYSNENIPVESVDSTNITSPAVVMSLNNDDLSYLESKTNNTPIHTDSTPQESSSYLVDPSFAPPPLPTPSDPLVSKPVYPTTQLTKSEQEIKFDPNHQFGYPSIDTLTISEVPKSLPSPQYNNNHNNHHVQTNNTNNNNNNNNNNVYSNQSPQYYPIQQTIHYQVPTYTTKTPQYNINNNNRLPATIMSPPVLANGIYSGGVPSRGQPFLSIAQQNQQQQQQQHQNITVNRNTTSSQASTSLQAVASSANQQPLPSTIAKVKTNLDSPEASKKYSKLRRIVISGEIFGDFMRMADNNTKRHIETCGILSGTLSNEIFTVTTLIIPKQEGTTDTCNTIEEQELFEYQLENDLLTLGWIHTHPTQDCFLSAVDVHTHCSYQFLLQEAIAVVISPMANPNFGIFRLTDPPGMETVKKCKLKSFHPHPPVGGVPIYTKVEHVDIVWGKKNCKVVDFRSK